MIRLLKERNKLTGDSLVIVENRTAQGSRARLRESSKATISVVVAPSSVGQGHPPDMKSVPLAAQTMEHQADPVTRSRP